MSKNDKNDNNNMKDIIEDIEKDIIERVIKGFNWYIEHCEGLLKNGEFREVRTSISDKEGAGFYNIFKKYIEKKGNLMAGCINNCEENFDTAFEELFIKYLGRFIEKFGLDLKNDNDLFLINDLRCIMKALIRRANQLLTKECLDKNIADATLSKEAIEEIFKQVEEDGKFKAFISKRKELVRKENRKLPSTLKEEAQKAALEAKKAREIEKAKAKEVAKAKAKEEAEARAAERARARAARRRVQQPINNIVEVNENQQPAQEEHAAPVVENQQQAQEPVVPAVENQQPAQQQGDQGVLEALAEIQAGLDNRIEQHDEGVQEREPVQEVVQGQNRHENQVAGQNNAQQQKLAVRLLHAAKEKFTGKGKGKQK